MDADWGNGFTAWMTVTNESNEKMKNWILEFDWDKDITSIWDAQIVSHVGNHYVIKSLNWNSTIAPKGKIKFGFVDRSGNVTTEPENCKLKFD